MHWCRFFLLQNLFQNFLITAEKPKIGFAITLIAGCTNMLLDWILVGICGLGIAGAAWATVTSQIVGGTVPFIYFVVSKSSILKLTGTRFEAKVITTTCGNGVSEFLLKGEELERFKKENIDLIDDKIRAVADEFCMDPEDILGLVLEYRFDMLDNFQPINK